MNDESIVEQKKRIRRVMKARRAALTDRTARSQLILQHLAQHPAYQRARTVLFYVDVRNEVQTRSLLEKELSSDRVIAVPYCQEGELRLVQLKSIEELQSGAYGILEPDCVLRSDEQRIVDPVQIDCALIPGVAFDLNGGRLGLGKGYYDKLMLQFRNDTTRIGVAFDCQIISELPTQQHDLCVDILMTESGEQFNFGCP